MKDVIIRAGLLSDLPRLAEIYNHYILNTPITFNTRPFTVEGFTDWFVDHGFAFDYVLYSNYDRQMRALLAGHIHIA